MNISNPGEKKRIRAVSLPTTQESRWKGEEWTKRRRIQSMANRKRNDK